MIEKPPTVQQTLWRNISAIMQHHYKGENLNQLVRDCKIGPGTASRIKEQKTSVGIDVLAKISAAFDLQPWHLLLPDLDPSNAPVSFLTAQERDLHNRLKRAHAILTQKDPQ